MADDRPNGTEDDLDAWRDDTTPTHVDALPAIADEQTTPVGANPLRDYERGHADGEQAGFADGYSVGVRRGAEQVLDAFRAGLVAEGTAPELAAELMHRLRALAGVNGF